MDEGPGLLNSVYVSLVAALFIVSPVVAQPNDTSVYDHYMRTFLSCRPGALTQSRQAFALNLSIVFHEHHVSTVLLTPAAIAELYVNPESGSYTILRVNTRDVACIALAGINRSLASSSLLDAVV